MKIFISSLLLIVAAKSILAEGQEIWHTTLQCSCDCVPKPTKVIMDVSTQKPTNVIMDVSSLKSTNVIMNFSSPKPTKAIMDDSSPKPTKVIMDDSSPKQTKVIMDFGSPKPTKVIRNFSSPKPNSCNKIVCRKQSKIIATLSSWLEVVCDTETDGGGWLVIQRRINGKLNFYRGWEEYMYGFADYINGEFFLGNEHIRRITTSAKYELRIDMVYAEKEYYALYSRFYLEEEHHGYILHVSGFSGNAGDSLEYSNGMRFTTFDRDNDNFGDGNCAVKKQGAWWYNTCAYSNLNGPWGENFFKGNYWQPLTHGYSLSKSEMKIRRNCLLKIKKKYIFLF